MPKLFVDVDDTLVNWEESAWDENWTLNGAVMEYVINWRTAFPDGVVVLWSGGGDDYADTWRNRLDPDQEIFDFSLGKFRIQPEDCEVFIDDMPDWLWHGKTIDPRRL